MAFLAEVLLKVQSSSDLSASIFSTVSFLVENPPSARIDVQVSLWVWLASLIMLLHIYLRLPSEAKLVGFLCWFILESRGS